MFVEAKRLPTLKHRRAAIIAISLLFMFGLFWSFTQQASAIKFENRGMYINSAVGGATTYYIISFEYPSINNVGSLRLEFCDTPIPSLPCNVPAGLDVSSGVLSTQSGETGFGITQQTQNLIVLSRPPSLTGPGVSSYRFDNMHNPDGEAQDFYVRMTSHASTDGSGPLIDYGSVSATTTQEVGIYTQVPPILIFCVGAVINDIECEDVVGNFVDFGELEPDQTYYTSSEMLARTNATFGYSISVTGTTMTSGIRSIPALTTPTQSFVGVGQFGINLAVNTTPPIGAAPTGPGTSAVLNPTYNTSDNFLFNNGDILVTSDGVTQTRKFTASYIVNVPADQAPGIYSTTITYVCLAGF